MNPIPAHTRILRITLVLMLTAIVLLLFAMYIRDRAVQNCPCLYQTEITQAPILS